MTALAAVATGLVAGAVATTTGPSTSGTDTTGTTDTIANAAAEAGTGQYVALGDSVAAGIGAGSPTPSSFDLKEDACFADEAKTVRVENSSLAYPRRVASALGAKLDFQAFCGATVKTTRNQQTETLNKSTGLVTVQVGANDFGFAGILTDCYLDNPPKTGSCNNQIDGVASRYRTELPTRLNTLYGTIKNKVSKNTKVIVVGYPHLVRNKSTVSCFGDGAWPTTTHQAINRAANVLNSVLKSQAAAHGFTFIDPQSSFKGHEICSDTEWVNGVSNPPVESFHPNAAGQQALGWLVWQHVKP